VPLFALRPRRALFAAAATLSVPLLVLGSCSDDEESSPGNPDLFCDAAREAFTGGTEFDFGDPAQRQQVLDVLDRMVEYAPGEIKDEAEDTRDAVTEYADQVAELGDRQAQVEDGAQEITPEDIEQIQQLVTDLEESEALQDAQAAIEPYLRDTCAVDLATTPSTTATTPTTAAGTEEAPATEQTPAP
jgi:uncharacterized protein YukE